MFSRLPPIAEDPLLGLTSAFRADPRPTKVDLGVGVYKDESGETPILSAVKTAQARLLERETTKAYLPQAGVVGFNQAIPELIFGSGHEASWRERVRCMTTVGSCGALSLIAELIVRAAPNARIWISEPGWINHTPIYASHGIEVKHYPYYDFAQHRLDFDRMMSALESARPGDVVLLQACCHNPSGADLSRDQWQRVADLCESRGLIPLLDMAYLGFGTGIAEDAWSTRLIVEQLPTVLVAFSCSKNFGLYRERVGALIVAADNSAEADTALGHAMQAARASYSMPPAHGASVVELILQDQGLRTSWQDELSDMRERLADLRTEFANRCHDRIAGRDFEFIRQQCGMFSFLGLSPQQVEAMQQQFGIYMAGSSRVNLAGLNQNNLDYVVDALASVL